MAYEPTNWKAGDTVTSAKLNKIEQGIAASGGGLLESLSDVDLSNPTNGQTLVYNSTSGKWENGSVGGGVMIVGESIDGNTVTLDKTWREICDALANGTIVVLPESSTDDTAMDIFCQASVEEGIYSVFIFERFEGQEVQFFTDSENGYPVLGVPI